MNAVRRMRGYKTRFEFSHALAEGGMKIGPSSLTDLEHGRRQLKPEEMRVVGRVLLGDRWKSMVNAIFSVGFGEAKVEDLVKAREEKNE